MTARMTTLSTLALLAAALAWPAHAADTVTVRSKSTSWAHMRAEATTHSAILGKVDNGTKLEVLGTSGDWTQVKWGDKTGYINNKLLIRSASK